MHSSILFHLDGFERYRVLWERSLREQSNFETFFWEGTSLSDTCHRIAGLNFGTCCSCFYTLMGRVSTPSATCPVLGELYCDDAVKHKPLNFQLAYWQSVLMIPHHDAAHVTICGHRCSSVERHRGKVEFNVRQAPFHMSGHCALGSLSLPFCAVMAPFPSLLFWLWHAFIVCVHLTYLLFIDCIVISVPSCL